MGEGSRGTLCFVRRASLTKRRCQFVDGMRRETEETGVLWWWVGVVGERGGQEWESSSLFTGCCGRRGAVGENDGPWEWVVSLDSTSLVPARWYHVQSVGCYECCDHSLDQRNCFYGCTHPLPERDTLCAVVTCSPFFHRKQQRVHVRTAKREGAQGSDGRISVATKQHKQKLDRSGCVLGSLGLRHENIDARRAG